MISKFALAATLWFGARLVIDGHLTVGELVAFNMLSGRVSGPVLRIAQLWQDFQQARLSIDRLGDILNTRSEAVVSSGQQSLRSEEHTSELQSLMRHSYAVFCLKKNKYMPYSLHSQQIA